MVQEFKFTLGHTRAVCCKKKYSLFSRTGFVPYGLVVCATIQATPRNAHFGLMRAVEKLLLPLFGRPRKLQSSYAICGTAIGVSALRGGVRS